MIPEPFPHESKHEQPLLLEASWPSSLVHLRAEESGVLVEPLERVEAGVTCPHRYKYSWQTYMFPHMCLLAVISISIYTLYMIYICIYIYYFIPPGVWVCVCIHIYIYTYISIYVHRCTNTPCSCVKYTRFMCYLKRYPYVPFELIFRHSFCNTI